MDGKDPTRVSLGTLQWRGGVVLSSRDPRFGGLSGLRWHQDRLLAISDDGNFWSLTPVERGGRLVGIGRVARTHLLTPDGQPLIGKPKADAESLEVESDSHLVHVGFEGQNLIHSYRLSSLDPPRLAPAGITGGAVAAAMADWPSNGGPEAVGLTRPGQVLILSEEAPGPEGSHVALLVTRSGGTDINGAVTRFFYRPPERFRPTDTIALGDGRMLVLNRRFSFLDGLAASLTLIDLRDVRPGDIVEAHELARLEPPVSVDNMEGMALRREGGRLMLYLISDDNFVPLQRNLLLKFELRLPQ